jgi:hypothetical protein
MTERQLVLPTYPLVFVNTRRLVERVAHALSQITYGGAMTKFILLDTIALNHSTLGALEQPGEVNMTPQLGSWRRHHSQVSIPIPACSDYLMTTLLPPVTLISVLLSLSLLRAPVLTMLVMMLLKLAMPQVLLPLFALLTPALMTVSVAAEAVADSP